MQTRTLEVITAAFGAGDVRVFAVSGGYFELLQCPSPVTVLLTDRTGVQLARLINVGETFFLRAGEFSEITISSAAAQQIQFAYGSAEAGTRRTSGSVSLSGMQGAYSQAAATVTNASGQLLAANLTRRYLLIQNKSGTGTVWVNLAGATATQGNGVRLAAGDSLELSSFVSSSQITAIGDIASNPDVVVVEG